MLAVFTLGISSRRCTSNGAIFGFILALIFGILIGFGPILSNINPVPLVRSTAGCKNLNPLISQTTTTDILTNSSNKSDNVFNTYLFKISYMWICPLTWLINTVAALIFSYLFPDKDLIVDECLLMPILRRKTNDLLV